MELLGQILIKRNIRYRLNTSLFNFDTCKGLTVKIYIYFGVHTTAMGFTSDSRWFLLIKTLLIKNNKKGEAALKNEARGDEKHVFLFFDLALLLLSLRCFSILVNFYFQITFNCKVIFVITWTKKIKISRLSSFKN